MDTLSSSVSTPTLQIPGFHSSTPPLAGVLHQFKPLLPPSSHSQHHFHESNSISKSNKPLISSINSSNSLFTRASKLQTSNSVLKLPGNRFEPTLHRKASMGYAAALLDIAQCNNTLHVIERDVRRFLKLLRSPNLNQNFVGDEHEKGEVVKEIAIHGRFQKHLVVVVKLLIEKKKQVWMVNEVLEEFQRIYSELSGKKTQVGFV